MHGFLRSKAALVVNYRANSRQPRAEGRLNGAPVVCQNRSRAHRPDQASKEQRSRARGRRALDGGVNVTVQRRGRLQIAVQRDNAVGKRSAQGIDDRDHSELSAGSAESRKHMQQARRGWSWFSHTPEPFRPVETFRLLFAHSLPTATRVREWRAERFHPSARAAPNRWPRRAARAPCCAHRPAETERPCAHCRAIPRCFLGAAPRLLSQAPYIPESSSGSSIRWRRAAPQYRQVRDTPERAREKWDR